MAHCDGRFYRDRTVAVIGGGNSAAEDALYLSRLAKTVYLVHRRDTLRAGRIYADSVISAENIEFLKNRRVSEIKTDDGRVTGVLLSSTDGTQSDSIALDGVFVSIGRDPATELFSDQLLLENGYIVADESTRTSIDGVFAVGDVRTKPLRQVVTATADGAVAVHFAEEYLAGLRSC